MASVNITALKAYFNAGDEPTEANFVDVFDSLLSLHADDDQTVAGATTFSDTATFSVGTVVTAGNHTLTDGNLVVTAADHGIIHTNSGTVTQSTNHTTGVTINATSGVITLAAAAVANATNAEFTVTNSTVQADSVILVTMQDENTTDNAQLSCAVHTIAGGSFKISIHHADSAGATSATASKIHFLVINNS